MFTAITHRGKTLGSAIGIAIVLVAAGCSSDAADTEPAASDDGRPTILAATPTPEPDPELETTELPAEEEGELINRFDLDPGLCFNTYGAVTADGEVQPTTRTVACTHPHESEVYYQRNYPAGAEQAFIGVGQLGTWAAERCYREFTEFTGSEYETSELEIGVVQPTAETWSGPGLHREITCYVYAVNGGGLQGSMAGSGI